MLKLRDVLSRWEAKQISRLEAVELMRVSERTFRPLEPNRALPLLREGL
jgi:hypothetical protein